MPLPKNEDMIEAFRPHRSNPPLGNGIGFRRLDRCSALSNAQAADTLIEKRPVASIPVLNEVTSRFMFVTGFYDLQRSPLDHGVCRYSHMSEFTTPMLYNKEHL